MLLPPPLQISQLTTLAENYEGKLAALNFLFPRTERLTPRDLPDALHLLDKASRILVRLASVRKTIIQAHDYTIEKINQAEAAAAQAADDSIQTIDTTIIEPSLIATTPIAPTPDAVTQDAVTPDAPQNITSPSPHPTDPTDPSDPSDPSHPSHSPLQPISEFPKLSPCAPPRPNPDPAAAELAADAAVHTPVCSTNIPACPSLINANLDSHAARTEAMLDDLQARLEGKLDDDFDPDDDPYEEKNEKFDPELWAREALRGILAKGPIKPELPPPP